MSVLIRIGWSLCFSRPPAAVVCVRECSDMHVGPALFEWCVKSSNFCKRSHITPRGLRFVRQKVKEKPLILDSEGSPRIAAGRGRETCDPHHTQRARPTDGPIYVYACTRHRCTVTAPPALRRTMTQQLKQKVEPSGGPKEVQHNVRRVSTPTLP